MESKIESVILRESFLDIVNFNLSFVYLLIRFDVWLDLDIILLDLVRNEYLFNFW